MSLPAHLAAPAPQAVFAALPGARAVGGCVRDALAGLPVADLDMAAPFPPEAIAARLRAAGLRVFETGLAHGTVTALHHGTPIEVTSLRRDLVTDGRHAEVAWTTDWAEDAARRDFTINSMSMGPDGILHDLHGGAVDLAAGRVRFVGDPATRLREDYLRALRFFRFQARYGRGVPDAAALSAIAAAVPGLSRLSPERVWMELKRLLAAPDPREALALMMAAGVLDAVVPEAAPVEFIILPRLIEIGAPPDPLLRFAALFGRCGQAPEPPEALCQASARLRLSGAERRRCQRFAAAVAIPGAHNAAAEIRMFLDDLASFEADTHEVAAGLLWMHEAKAVCPGKAMSLAADFAALHHAVAKTPVPVFPLRGQDALDLGAEPGPAIGRIIGQVRQWWFDTGANASRPDCLEHLRQLVQSPPG